MIAYDIWLIYRNLTDSQGAGVDFGDRRKSGNIVGKGLDAAAGAAVGKDTESAVLRAVASAGLVSAGLGFDPTTAFPTDALGLVDVRMAVHFLRALGDMKTVARPTISMLSARSPDFNSGKKCGYIWSTTTSIDSESNTRDVWPEVETLETGVEIKVAGAHNAGVIFTNFSMRGPK